MKGKGQMDHDYKQFIQSFYKLTGIDLSKYKESQMKRRLTSLYEKRGYQSFQSFFEHVKQNSDLLKELLDKMTINVSEFYRNAPRWDILRQQILPELVKSKLKLNTWSAACSTGEEPYTLAMILSLFLPLSNLNILATDIDEKALLHAKQAKYLDRSLQELPHDLRDKWFIHDNGWYYLKDELKKAIHFKRFNLLNDEFPQGMDMIVCRNVLIYFTEDAKRVLYRKFAEALSHEGILFVGSTEQIFRPEEFGLKLVSPFFYRRILEG